MCVSVISLLIVFNSSSAVVALLERVGWGCTQPFLIKRFPVIQGIKVVSFYSCSLSFSFFPFKLELASPEGERLAQLCYPVRLLKPCLDKKLLYAFLTTVPDFHFVRHLF